MDLPNSIIHIKIHITRCRYRYVLIRRIRSRWGRVSGSFECLSQANHDSAFPGLWDSPFFFLHPFPSTLPPFHSSSSACVSNPRGVARLFHTARFSIDTHTHPPASARPLAARERLVTCKVFPIRRAILHL